MGKEVGIQFDLTAMEDATLANKVFTAADWDAYVWTWTTPPNPTFMLSVESCNTYHVLSDTYYCNSRYERLFDAQATEPNFKRRQRLVYQAQKLFHDDLAYVVLYYPARLEAHRTDKLAGWLNQPNGITDNWTEANYFALRPK
jgi:peptide/nickel transport system substrate-binding protein